MSAQATVHSFKMNHISLRFHWVVAMSCPLVAELVWAATDDTDGENLVTHNGFKQEGWRDSNPQRIPPPNSKNLKHIKKQTFLQKEKIRCHIDLVTDIECSFNLNFMKQVTSD